MGVVGRAVRRTPGPRERSLAAITLDQIFGGMYADRDTDAGIRVSPEKALGIPAVGNAIRLISRNVGTLPLITYQGKTDGRDRLTGDPVYRLLRRQPNDFMNATVCWTATIRHLAGWGEAFLGKDRVTTGRGDSIAGLWPIKPELVTVELKGGEKKFRVGTKVYTTDDVIHVMLDSHDGYVGLSPIEQHREALGYQLVLRRYGSKTVGKRGIPPIALRIKKSLPDPKAKARLREEWKRLYSDEGLAEKVAILDEDAEVEKLSIPLVDAQFIEQMRYGVSEVAQIFNMPVHKLQGSTGDSLTYNTREGHQLDFLEALRPYMVALEDALNADGELFAPGSARYCEFLPEALLRVETKTRAEVAQIELAGAPYKRPSEKRREENLPADAGFDFVPAQRGAATGAAGQTPNQEG